MARDQLTRESFVRQARKALVTSGVEEVKVDKIASQLKVTRGSFYWHFKNRQALLDALIEDWESNNRREIATMEQRVADGVTGLQEVFHIWLGEDASFPSFDLAVRVWARKSKHVAGIVREIDAAWIQLFQSIFERSGVTQPESIVRARITYLHQIGYYALGMRESIEERIDLMPHYFAALTGSPAPEGMSETLRRGANIAPSTTKSKKTGNSKT